MGGFPRYVYWCIPYTVPVTNLAPTVPIVWGAIIIAVMLFMAFGTNLPLAFRTRHQSCIELLWCYGRSPDRSTRVCNLCENGDYIQDEKHVIFSCIGTEHLQHQFILLFDNISEGDIKNYVFQHNS